MNCARAWLGLPRWPRAQLQGSFCNATVADEAWGSLFDFFEKYL